MYILRFIILLVLLAFSGCAVKEPIKSQRVYEGIPKYKILDAAKRLLKHSSDIDVLIDSYRDEVNGTKIIPIYQVISMDLKVNNFSLRVEENNETNETAKNISATLELFSTNGINEEDKDYYDLSVHDVVWSQIDYFLGLNKYWKECFKHNSSINILGEIECKALYIAGGRLVHKPLENDRYKTEDEKKEEMVLAEIVIPETNLLDANSTIDSNEIDLDDIELDNVDLSGNIDDVNIEDIDLSGIEENIPKHKEVDFKDDNISQVSEFKLVESDILIDIEDKKFDLNSSK